jgi:hypothetical protein
MTILLSPAPSVNLPLTDLDLILGGSAQRDTPYPTPEDASWWAEETGEHDSPEFILDVDLIDEAFELARFSALYEAGVPFC